MYTFCIGQSGFGLEHIFLFVQNSYGFIFKHLVEMCPLDDKSVTNMAAKMCTALFEVSELMYNK